MWNGFGKGINIDLVCVVGGRGAVGVGCPAQSEEKVTLDLRVVSSNPRLGVAITSINNEINF